MRSNLPKVLHEVGDRPLLEHVIDGAEQLNPEKIHVIHGHCAEFVKERLAHRDVSWVYQSEQAGTGHAVAQAMPDIPNEASVLVLYGDVPLIEVSTLQELVATSNDSTVAILTVMMKNPTGYGRIVRDTKNIVRSIVEQKDASPEQLLINEVNTGLMSVPAGRLRQWLSNLSNDNAQGEYYLTDIVSAAVIDGIDVTAVQANDENEVMGVNNREQLAECEREFQIRQARKMMVEGLALKDPARFELRGSLQVGKDVKVDVGCVFEGDVVLGDNVSIAANCVIRNSSIGAGTHIEPMSMLEDTTVAENCNIGPFARLRPGTELADGAKVGNFVETKKAKVGTGSKINHLSYVGDAEIGTDVNVGAGVITCNYDGANKHQTVIGDNAFIGSDCQLVAPVEVGAGATVAAGTTLTKKAPDDQLTLSRVKQRTVEGWKRPTKG